LIQAKEEKITENQLFSDIACEKRNTTEKNALFLCNSDQPRSPLLADPVSSSDQVVGTSGADRCWPSPDAELEQMLAVDGSQGRTDAR
jgi:hypothetical protein